MISANNITPVSGSQLKADPSDIVKPRPEPAQKESTTPPEESVTISAKAKDLQQQFSQDKTVIEDRYTRNSNALEREYLQEKSSLEREYNQQKKSLEINIYA